MFWSPQSVRRLVLGVMVVLVLQYALVGIVGVVLREPWPTLVLPAFQNVWDGDDELAVPRARLIAISSDSTSFEVPVDAVWSAVPTSQQAGFLREQCRPQTLSGTPRTERCTLPEARAWMRTQLQDRYPLHQIERLDVVWEEVFFNVNERTTAQAPRAQPTDTLRVPL
ncbi:hypothetical protein CRI93_03220 [Longimonas halophila]|uniref:Uncharacterized protein n=1 Tax=Longimonas halophila TaxID=1469170 RepID=A0A2H3P3B9_9BACT|nr:hypothetical protein [Longimonas halophila]PEN08782.1 hypothetical protein CRI93_03220 [Longimonas halophila]